MIQFKIFTAIKIFTEVGAKNLRFLLFFEIVQIYGFEKIL